jgi:hypothetical protein
MWYTMGWVLQTTMYYTTYYHNYSRTVAVTTWHHSSSIAASLHSAAVDPSTRLREAGLSGGGTLSVCVRAHMLRVSPPCCGAMVERDLRHLTRPETRTQWHVLFFCRLVCVRVGQRRVSVLPSSVC